MTIRIRQLTFGPLLKQRCNKWIKIESTMAWESFDVEFLIYLVAEKKKWFNLEAQSLRHHNIQSNHNIFIHLPQNKFYFHLWFFLCKDIK